MYCCSSQARIYDNKANSQGPMYITIGDAGNNKAHKYHSDNMSCSQTKCILVVLMNATNN